MGKRSEEWRLNPLTYCPNCGASALVPGFHYHPSAPTFHCTNCHIGFSDTVAGRWLALKFRGTSARRVTEAKVMPAFGQSHPRNAKMLKRAGLELIIDG